MNPIKILGDHLSAHYNAAVDYTLDTLDKFSTEFPGSFALLEKIVGVGELAIPKDFEPAAFSFLLEKGFIDQNKNLSPAITSIFEKFFGSHVKDAIHSLLNNEQSLDELLEANPNLKESKKFMIAAYTFKDDRKYHESICEKMSKRLNIVLSNDYEFMVNTCIGNPMGTGDELSNNKDYIRKVISINPHYASEMSDNLREDQAFMLEIFSIIPDFSHRIGERLRNNSCFARKAIQMDKDFLYNISFILKNDPEFMLSVLSKENLFEFFYNLNPRLKDNREFMLSASTIVSESFRYASHDLKTDPQVVKDAVTKNPFVLEFVNQEFQNNNDIVHTAVSILGATLRFASPRLRGDTRTVELAVTNNGLSIEHASDRLRKNGRMVNSAIESNPDAVEFFL